jgi:hypothetical protein
VQFVLSTMTVPSSGQILNLITIVNNLLKTGMIFDVTK